MVKLTPREQEVLGLMAEGKSNQQICDKLIISEGTIKRHTTNIYGKFGLECTKQQSARVKAVILGIQNGLINVSMLNVE